MENEEIDITDTPIDWAAWGITINEDGQDLFEKFGIDPNCVDEDGLKRFGL